MNRRMATGALLLAAALCLTLAASASGAGRQPANAEQAQLILGLEAAGDATVASATPQTNLGQITVNSSDDVDDGACDASHCSLREALEEANANDGADVVAFNIPANDPGCSVTGVCAIQPQQLLPPVTDDETTIDGYSQPGAVPGASPTLKIVIDGANNGNFSGLALRSAFNHVRGLVIQRFTPFSGMHIEGAAAHHNQVEGNYFGTDASGTQPAGNCTPPTSCAAIRLEFGAADNVIGPHNLVAFNGQGVWVVDEATHGNTITQNSIHDNDLAGIEIGSEVVDQQPAPTIDAAGPTQVQGSACPGCLVEIFSDKADEGGLYEGSTVAGGSGAWSFNQPAGLQGPNVTATATDAQGNTSEFSAAAAVPASQAIYLPLVLR